MHPSRGEDREDGGYSIYHQPLFRSLPFSWSVCWTIGQLRESVYNEIQCPKAYLLQYI